MDYNKRLDVFNPSTNQNLYYSKLRENPSYGSELPQDFTYDPGATRSIFELGYVPSGSAILGGTAFIILVVFLLTILFNKTKITLETIQKNVVIVSFILVSLGPIRLPGAFIFQTGLGLAKAGAVFGVITGLIAQRNMLWTLFSHNRSRTPLIVYISSLFVSALFITNPTFFVEDISLIIGGLIFYSAGYLAPDAHMSSKKIISGIQATILLPIGLIFLGFFLGTQTINLIGTLYPRYENIMFQFDMSRGRILSIMDIEFFAPILVYSLLTHGKVLWKYLTLSLLFIAVFFTNYRYRFITLALGLYIQLVTLPKEYSSKITRNLLGIFIVMFVLYNGMAISTGRPTIVDRFLLKNYQTDVDSLQRRVVMAGQALEVFIQFPVFGVGLGNYKDNVQVVYESFGGRFYEPYYKILQNVYAYPHNWFLLILAEGGVIGLVVVLWLLYTFYQTDKKLYRVLEGDERNVFITLSLITWLFVLANQFTPLNNSQPMVIFFWGFRGIIDRIYYTYVESNPTH